MSSYCDYSNYRLKAEEEALQELQREEERRQQELEAQKKQVKHSFYSLTVLYIYNHL